MYFISLMILFIVIIFPIGVLLESLYSEKQNGSALD